MRKENFIQIFLIAFLILGCGTPAAPTQLPIDSPTTTFPTLTSTPLPIATEISATSTLTPEPSLRTKGPYFAYFREVNKAYQLVMLDADGEGRKVIDLPQGFVDSLTNQQYDLDMKFVSPDGKWLAFYSGSAGKYGEMPAQRQSDLTLNLLNIATGEKQVVTPLLSKDYPNNFAEAAKALNDPYKTAESLFDAFVSGITQALDWSPDGRYLAFAGQMDGLSSDLYLYDMTNKKIQRYSSGDQELQWINWSPNGRWILHSSVYYVGEGMSFDIYVDGSSVHYISTNSLYCGIEKWLNPHIYFENDSQNGPGNYGLRSVDINTGKIAKIWDGSFDSFAVDNSGKWISIRANTPKWPYEGDDPNFRSGIYLINLVTLEKLKVEVPDNTHVYSAPNTFGLGGQEFVIMDLTSSNPLMFLSVDGRLTQTDLGNAKISVSPKSEYWTAVTNRDIKIFSADNTLIKTLPLSTSDAKINDVEWRSDSSGLFLVNGIDIYSLNILQGSINLVETDLVENYGCGSTYKWINGQ